MAGVVVGLSVAVTVAVMVSVGRPGVAVGVLNAGAMTRILTQILSAPWVPTPNVLPSGVCNCQMPS